MKKVTAIIACLVLVLTLFSANAGEKKPPKGPIRVFLLSGQSNMTGRGNLGNLKAPPAEQKATLVHYIMAAENKSKYAHLYSGPDKTRTGWTIRDDVFITIGGKHGGLGPYYGGFRNKGFGPELGIGHVLGEHYDETVLLVKCSFGANSLGGNFRPPSSGGKLGDKYPLVIKAVRDAIAQLGKIIPGYTDKHGYEIVGFFWNQGCHDTNQRYAGEYEKNLANLITDLRKEFRAPDMKAVIGVTGNYGWDLTDMLKWKKTQEQKDAASAIWNTVRKAQVAVSKRPAFKGTVATAETRDFWRPREKHGGNNQGVHWHGNGESYWLIGEAMGRTMVELLKGKAAPEPVRIGQ